MTLFKGKYGFFREEAVEHYLREPEAAGLLRVSPILAWVALAFAGSLLLAFFCFSAAVAVEVTERGKGILRPVSGMRLLTAQSSGTVVELPFRPGDEVKTGQLIVLLNNPQLLGSKLEVDRQYALMQRSLPEVARSQDALYERQLKDLPAKIKTLEEDIRSFTLSEQHQANRLKAVQELQRSGISSQIDIDLAVDSHESARRALRQSHANLRTAIQEREALVSAHRQQVYSRENDRQNLESRRDSTVLSDTLLRVSSPITGFLDGLTVRYGEVVSAGQALARVVPADSPLEVTVFLPERHRAFVRGSDQVVIELAQFPFQEFGFLKGRILRVGEGLATSAEWREALGDSAKEDEPSFRVDIEILPDQSKAMSKVRLRPSMLLQARFTLRRKTILSFALEPLKRWLW